MAHAYKRLLHTVVCVVGDADYCQIVPESLKIRNWHGRSICSEKPREDKFRELIPYIGPTPIIIPLKIFLNLLLDPLFPRELSVKSLILPILTAGRSPTQSFTTFANQIVCTLQP